MKNLYMNQVFLSRFFPLNNSKFLSLSGIKLLLFVVIAGFNQGYSQTTVFSDDFESGIGNWTLQGTWELTTSMSYSLNNSLTTANSSGTYLANQNISATMAHGVDLSSYKGAEINFYGQYVLEQLV
jgi:hypothetical protein